MLNNESRPANPAAIAATPFSCAGESAVKATSGWPTSEPPKISCSMGLATSITPMPAETLRHSTPHSSQNCGVRQAALTCTDRVAARALPGPRPG